MSNNKEKIKVVCFGEILFDIFPTHRKIGGAPLNVASRLASFGIHSEIISRVGIDENGEDLITYIQENGINSDSIQVDTENPTGEVIVALDKNGSASYTISYPVAWDKIECLLEDEIKVSQADAFVFGSLVCRDVVSYNSLLKLMKKAKYSVFDVNLRAPFYTENLLKELMVAADFIKFNDDELLEIAGFYQSPYKTLEENILFIAEKTNTKRICVTKGSEGAVLFYNEKMYYNTGYKVNVVDTVGSGDSFLAGLLNELLTKKDPQEAIDFACALGALVAKNEGANPILSNSEIRKFMNK